MTIIRTVHNKDNPYTMINTTIATDARVSWKAKGIWLYAFSRPNDWVFYICDIIKHSPEGKDSVQNGLKELQKAGYLHKTRKRGEGGKFIPDDWTFYETAREPVPIESEFKKTLPQPGFPPEVNPPQENPPLPSIEENLLLKETTTSQPESPGQKKTTTDANTDSSSFFFKKESLLKELPLNEETRNRAMLFSQEQIKNAIHNTKKRMSLLSTEEKEDFSVGGYFFNQLKNGYEKKETKEDKACIAKESKEKRTDENRKKCLQYVTDHEHTFSDKIKIKMHDYNVDIKTQRGFSALAYSDYNFMRDFLRAVENK